MLGNEDGSTAKALMPRRFLFGVFIAGLASSQAAGAAEGIPAIDEMASQWLNVAEIVHMPSLHNFHEMAACSPNLLGVNYIPGGQLFAGSGRRWYKYRTLPHCQLMIGGKTHEATTCRWYPYQAVRRRTVGGLEIESRVRMVVEGPGILYRVLVKNTSGAARQVDLAVKVPGSITGSGGDAVVVHTSQRPLLCMAHAFSRKPDRLQADADATLAGWRLLLKPGGVARLDLGMAHADAAEDKSKGAAQAAQAARAWAQGFDRVWDEAKARWAKRWQQAFTPGNAHFSGHLPVLVTSDEKLRDVYYRSILTLLALHRTNLAKCSRVFITSGERAKGVVYFWDTSMWSKVFALLEPRGMKEHLRLFLQCDPHRGPVYYMHHGRQSGGWYAANDMVIFRLAYSYLSVTGDGAFLDEKLGDRTVLAHLDRLATNWKKLQRDTSLPLADYGENRNLLECAPKYVHRVPSFNAANVWMMRTVAGLYERTGDAAKAKALRAEAGKMAEAVLGLYVPGEGVWCALHRDGKRVELRHCYDFTCVGRFMTDDLSDTMKREMVRFVQRELLTKHWMRAMSQRDQAAKVSDRPDHGPMGAFDAWPALTAESMCRLGAWRSALGFVRRTQSALKEGVYAQAREHWGPRRAEYDAPVRIAMRRGCMRECVGGGAFAEMIIGALFGYSPELGRPLALYEPKAPRSFAGKLLHLRHSGKLHTLVSGDGGVSVSPE